jgi:hypothetical protein
MYIPEINLSALIDNLLTKELFDHKIKLMLTFLKLLPSKFNVGNDVLFQYYIVYQKLFYYTEFILWLKSII